MEQCFPVVVREESPVIGSAGMTPDELRVTKFRESCVLKAMFSCAGGDCVSLIFDHQIWSSIDPSVEH